VTAFWWLPLVFLLNLGYAYLSRENSLSKDFKMVLIIWVYGAIFQFWPLVSRFSKNILFDGLIYDSALVVSYVLACIWLGYAEKMNLVQAFGMILVVIGITLMKLK
jgi:multidrug transporter EmrE-like cation transporter